MCSRLFVPVDPTTHLPADWQSEVDSAHLAAGGSGAVTHLGAGVMSFPSARAHGCILCDSMMTAGILVGHMKHRYRENIVCFILQTVGPVEII